MCDWKILRIVDPDYFAGLIFTDACICAHYLLYDRGHFADLIFTVIQQSAKTMKIGPLKNFLLHGMSSVYRKCGFLQISLQLESDKDCTAVVAVVSYSGKVLWGSIFVDSKSLLFRGFNFHGHEHSLPLYTV